MCRGVTRIFKRRRQKKGKTTGLKPSLVATINQNDDVITTIVYVLKAMLILLFPELSHTFSISFGQGILSQLINPIAKAFNRSFAIVFRHQVLRRRRELKDLSHEQEPTGRLRSSINIACMLG